MVHITKNLLELSSSNTLSASKHTLPLAFLCKKTYPSYCIFCQNHTLDIGTPVVLHLFNVSVSSGLTSLLIQMPAAKHLHSLHHNALMLKDFFILQVEPY